MGRGARVRRFRALRGGTSSAMHAVDVEIQGTVHRLVLRRFVLGDWLEEEPDVPAQEAIALATLAGAAVPTPHLVAVDATGAGAGDPVVLMTRLAGRVEWDPRDRETYLRRLAEPLPAIHAIAPDPRIRPYDPYELYSDEPPSWSRRPDVWRRAIEIRLGPPPAAGDCLIHRDYHPGNVLWRRGAVSGIVDWASASRGVPEADVGYCRGNLADRLGVDAADRFLELYQALTGRDDYDPYWDVVAALGGIDLEHEAGPDSEAFLAAALARS